MTEASVEYTTRGTPRQRAAGAGRPRVTEHHHAPRTTFTLSEEHIEWLKAYGNGNASKGIRKLIEEAMSR